MEPRKEAQIQKYVSPDINLDTGSSAQPSISSSSRVTGSGRGEDGDAGGGGDDDGGDGGDDGDGGDGGDDGDDGEETYL